MPRLPFLFAWLFAAATANAQVTQAELDEVRQASPAKIDFIMKSTAEAAAKSFPAQVDAITTVLTALYLQHNRTLVYSGRVTQQLTEQEQFEFSYQLQTQVCRSALNKAFMAKGVSYQYRYALPKENLVFTYNQASCK